MKLLKRRLGEIGQGRLVGPDIERTTFEDLVEMLTDDYKANQRRSFNRVIGSVGVVYYIESRRFLIRDSPRPATTYEQKTGGADGVKGA